MDIYNIEKKLEEVGEIAKAVAPETRFKNGFVVPANYDYTDMDFTSSFGDIHINDSGMQAMDDWEPGDDDEDMYQEPVVTLNGEEIPLVDSEDELWLFQNDAYTILYETSSEGTAVVFVSICKTTDL